jgi:signal transduction histidine kinase
MDNETSQFGDISARRLTSPACRLRIENGQLVVSGINDAFESAFSDPENHHSATDRDSVPAETLVAETLDTGQDWETLRETILDGDQFTGITATESRYAVDATPPTDDDEGYLLFTDVTDMTESDSMDTDSGIAVDHVASVVSHDLRNPLDVARARLRAGRDLGEDEHFEHVAQAHERMERIIQDVLTLARGEDVVDPDERVELGAIAQQAWETVETNGATLSVESELPTALADPDRVSRLFENLFRNALEHGKRDGESVAVRVGRLDEANPDGFYVADDGPGVDSEHRDDIFEPGYSTDDHGTGLGLAIVARIGELHGWDVAVTESDGGGARFEFGGVE